MTSSTDQLPDIPRPELLDPHRVNSDDREDLTAEQHRSQAQLLASALDKSCAYASQLWENAAAVRGYLHDHTPDPADEAAWTQWQKAYAAVVSVLCGPHGDSGFGSRQARLIAQDRRG